MAAETGARTFFLLLSIRSILGTLVSLLSLTTLQKQAKNMEERITNG